jgi:hypothetical protein
VRGHQRENCTKLIQCKSKVMGPVRQGCLFCHPVKLSMPHLDLLNLLDTRLFSSSLSRCVVRKEPQLIHTEVQVASDISTSIKHFMSLPPRVDSFMETGGSTTDF